MSAINMPVSPTRPIGDDEDLVLPSDDDELQMFTVVSAHRRSSPSPAIPPMDLNYLHGQQVPVMGVSLEETNISSRHHSPQAGKTAIRPQKQVLPPVIDLGDDSDYDEAKKPTKKSKKPKKEVKLKAPKKARQRKEKPASVVSIDSAAPSVEEISAPVPTPGPSRPKKRKADEIAREDTAHTDHVQKKARNESSAPVIVNSSDQKKSRKRPKSGGLPEDETYGAEDGQMESDDDDELNLTGVAHVRKVSPKQKKASRKSKVPKTRIEEAAPLQPEVVVEVVNSSSAQSAPSPTKPIHSPPKRPTETPLRDKNTTYMTPMAQSGPNSTNAANRRMSLHTIPRRVSTSELLNKTGLHARLSSSRLTKTGGAKIAPLHFNRRTPPPPPPPMPKTKKKKGEEEVDSEDEYWGMTEKEIKKRKEEKKMLAWYSP